MDDRVILAAVDRGPMASRAILAPIDLVADRRRQLAMASRLSCVGSQRLILMTVATSRVSDRDAAAALRTVAHNVTPIKPTSLIVRRVAAEISNCAIAEGAGLVILGLDGRQPGTIAKAVLKTGRAFVLAVPPHRG